MRIITAGSSGRMANWKREKRANAYDFVYLHTPLKRDQFRKQLNPVGTTHKATHDRQERDFNPPDFGIPARPPFKAIYAFLRGCHIYNDPSPI